MILKWLDVLKFANNGNPTPDRRIEKKEEEWKSILTSEQFRITRLKGTEMKEHTAPIYAACLKQADIPASVAIPLFLTARKNSKAERAGHPLPSLLKRTPLPIIKIKASECIELKRFVILAMHIWDTYFKTVLRRADYVFVSMP